MIYNPRAGKLGRNGQGRLERVVEILRRDGHQVMLAPTTGPRMAGALAREQVQRGADLVLVAGGDGTVNEVAEGLIGSDVPIGILPAGTANVLANEMKLGSRLERVAARLERCRPYRIPVGHVTCHDGGVSRHFLLMAGIGLDAHIVYRVSVPLKSATGKFAYWVAGWSLLGRRLPEFTVEMNGTRRTCSFALVSKVRNYGGDFEIARNVHLFDDRFEVVLFEGRSTLPYVKYFGGLMFNRLAGMKGVTVERAQCLRVLAPEDRRVYLQIDGESAGRLPAEIRIVPDALTLLVPPEYAR